MPRTSIALLLRLPLLVLATLLTASGCEREPHVLPEWQRPPQLMDATTQTYRFMDGRCRSIARLPAPWRLQPDESTPALLNAWIEIEADTAAFDLPPPPRHRRGGDDQHRIRATIGTRKPPTRDDPELSPLWQIYYGLRSPGEPIAPPRAIPPGYLAYRWPSGRVIYTDPPRRLIVLDRDTEYMPNGWMEGIVRFDAVQGAGFRLPYEALPMLDRLSAQLAVVNTALLVPCPTVSPPPGAPR